MVQLREEFPVFTLLVFKTGSFGVVFPAELSELVLQVIPLLFRLQRPRFHFPKLSLRQLLLFLVFFLKIIKNLKPYISDPKSLLVAGFQFFCSLPISP